ncbi:T6SS effector phospholipase Tle3 domain-containing protein [Cupriavidus taiwanensis]|uniref:T6SS Tle3 phospholipase effector alpha/beta domain-containing protein n=2 Tax=Cupriavidus taiwanensis TaxID=164546 RepID=A0A375BU33_9BURK|nr:conserved hypothetical protein [Cupriavidus taiwanensis]
MSHQADYSAESLTLPGSPRVDLDYPALLPGVVIYVHGVNSTGEWFEDSETGICAGLNTRLQRNTDQVFRVGGSGQLRPATYRRELTEDGFIVDDLSADAFVSEPGYSPIIRFRWGYKASKDELATVGGNILLDEADAWGGGPFANGCSALPDMFGGGVDTGLFLGVAVQDMNPSDRLIYSCPPRHYQAFAAWRLAKLVARVREMHRARYGGKDCPVTLVCHSQGNMIGIGSAFFGANHPDLGGLGVADTYVLANAPYSLQKNRLDNYAQYDLKTMQGRVKHDARVKTLAAFFDLVRSGPGRHASDEEVNLEVMNSAPRNGDKPRKADQDRAERATRKRVFLYCNPHDRVISVSTVQGMGWLGLSQEEVTATKAEGVLYQRVWAQAGLPGGEAFKVGNSPGFTYDYWKHTIGACPEQNQFWEPQADRLSLQISEIWDDPRRTVLGKAAVTAIGGLAQFVISAITTAGGKAAYANAEPDRHWSVNISAPAVPGGGIVPRALYLPRGSGQKLEGETPSGLKTSTGADDARVSGPFNRHKESATDALNPNRAAGADDPYARQRASGHGDGASEAAMRYDQNAAIRQKARRYIYAEDGSLQPDSPYSEKDVEKLDAKRHDEIRNTRFGEFAQETRMGLLAKGVDQQASNHSTILTNPAHSEEVLAYDVDVGVCYFNSAELDQLRRMADWRWCKPKTDDIGSDLKKDNEWEYHALASVGGQGMSDINAFNSMSGTLDRLRINGARNSWPLQAANNPSGNDHNVA